MANHPGKRSRKRWRRAASKSALAGVIAAAFAMAPHSARSDCEAWLGLCLDLCSADHSLCVEPCDRIKEEADEECIRIYGECENECVENPFPYESITVCKQQRCDPPKSACLNTSEGDHRSCLETCDRDKFRCNDYCYEEYSTCS